MISADPDANTFTVAGETMPLTLPPPAPLTSINFDFTGSLAGWQLGPNLMAGRADPTALTLRVVGPDPQLYSPPLRVRGDDVPAVEIRMRATAGELGQFYFTTEASPGLSEDRCIHLQVVPDGEYHTYRLETGQHPQWAGQVIAAIRFDPVHGPEQADVAVDYMRGVGK